MNVLFGRGITDAPLVSAGIKIAGLLSTALYWVLQERTMAFWYVFVNRATEHEAELGFKQYSMRPKAGPVSTRVVIRVFFLAIGAFWVLSLVWYP